jgi:type I restriction enzyme S subunit
MLTTTSFLNYVENNQEGAGYPSIPNSKVKQFSIPVPSMTEQERIVSILNKFDALVNDISIGLPAEIEGRRKQYEYYRNKLLAFKMSES